VARGDRAAWLAIGLALAAIARGRRRRAIEPC
jgi:hypothetical protein